MPIHFCQTGVSESIPALIRISTIQTVLNVLDCRNGPTARPELFANIYSMSPRCLMHNPQPRPAGAPEPAPPKGNVDVDSGEAAAWSPNSLNPHSFEAYAADHTNRLRQRVEEKVLPLFTQQLTFAEPKKAR